MANFMSFQNAYDTLSEYANAINGKIAKLSIVPTASASNVGMIFQYVGADTQNFRNGFFYQCEEAGSGTGVYGWAAKSVQQIAESNRISDADDLKTSGRYLCYTEITDNLPTDDRCIYVVEVHTFSISDVSYVYQIAYRGNINLDSSIYTRQYNSSANNWTVWYPVAMADNLAAVATSGDYNDLINKPISAGTVPVDPSSTSDMNIWIETDQ